MTQRNVISAIEDGNPVLLIEHRWLHSLKGHVPEGYYSLKLEGCCRVIEGHDITLVSLPMESMSAGHAMNCETIISVLN